VSEGDPELRAREEARRRRIGRLAVVFLGLLVLVYLVPLFLRLMGVRL
jgi:hypothetical protein